MNLDTIPDELKVLSQWVVVNIDADGVKRPICPNNLKGYRYASVIDPTTWGTYEQACLAINPKHPVIGFVLRDKDPYTFIDLDIKESSSLTDESAREIIRFFDSYSEKSPSGKGYHIIVKGRVPRGLKTPGIEMYSSRRYMTVTGDCVHGMPICERQDQIDEVYKDLRSTQGVELDCGDVEDGPQILDDNEVIQCIVDSGVSDKFYRLYAGHWQNSFPSQSEADFALLSFFCYYSHNNAQVMRLFRESELGKREKATRNDFYLLNSIKSYRRKHPENADREKLAEQFKNFYVDRVDAPKESDPPKESSSFKHAKPAAPISRSDIPGGLIGELYEYFMATSMRPVKEFALTAALAFMSGMCGRAYNISGAGLNQYILVLSGTGRGKETMRKGIDALIKAVAKKVPLIYNYCGPDEVTSGAAIRNVLSRNPCQFSIFGEFTQSLQEMSDAKASSAKQSLGRMFLDLYSKSGKNNETREYAYADSQRTIPRTLSPAWTVLAEGTPEKFYDNLTTDLIDIGLIPRFVVVTYNGPRVPTNDNHGCPPSDYLVDKVASLMTNITTLDATNQVLDVSLDSEATELFKLFDKKTDRVINASMAEGDDPTLQLWNRAHLKALKFAAVVAIGHNPYNPIVTKDIAKWAIAFEEVEIQTMFNKFATNGLGEGDARRIFDVEQAIESYFSKTDSNIAHLQKERIITFRYLSQRTSNVKSFRTDPLGSSASLKKMLQVMMDRGSLAEVPFTELKKLGFRGKAYFVTERI